MSFRDFFATNSWWGKILGALFGYLTAGSTGAVFGLLVGNFFDRGLSSYYGDPHWIFFAEKQHNTQKIFFEAIFAIIGYIAKADGRVSEDEINMARDLMKKMQLNKEQSLSAMHLFNKGKNAQFNLQDTLSQVYAACKYNPELLKLFMDILYQAARTDGLSTNKIKILDTIFLQLGFRPFHQQYRFYEDFGATNSENDKQQSYQHSSSQSYSSYNYQPTGTKLDQAYSILEINSNSSKQDVKKAYRRLLSKNHPDKLIAQGLPPEMIKIANEKTQKIVKAYEMICKSKGWN